MDTGSIQRIAILRALQLGDLLCAIPAWRALRASFPAARISLIGLPWARQFVSRFRHYLDEFIEFPGFPGLPERPCAADAIPSFLRDMQQRRFDLALQMHGNGRYANVVMPLFGARASAGFSVPGGWSPDVDRYIPYPDTIPEVQRHLCLMQSLGVPSAGDHLEWPITPADEAAFMRLDESRSLSGSDYVCIHPGGRGALRRWNPEHFGRVADLLSTRGVRVVITGTREECRLAETMIGARRTSAINMVGLTDLGSLGVLLRGAKALIANDTGVSHIAAGLRLPSVIVCTGSDPVRWGPSDRHRHRVLLGSCATPESVIDELDDVVHSRSRPADAEVPV